MQKKGRKAEAGRVEKDEILPEYDFSDARPNKYAARYAAGSTVVVLEPDVATVFPSAGEVNEGLRALAGIIHKHRPAGPLIARAINTESCIPERFPIADDQPDALEALRARSKKRAFRPKV
jgi:hypothetical protein